MLPCPQKIAALRHFRRQGQRLYEAGATGIAWRLLAGAVRLDAVHEGVAEFAGLAVAGDIVGTETLLDERYAFRATALVPALLEPWPDRTPQRRQLLLTLAQAERRSAAVVALRTGPAAERVRRLLQLLAPAVDGGGLVVLPTLRDMADITALAMETVSRSIGFLRRQGLIEPDGNRPDSRSNRACRLRPLPQPDQPQAALSS